MYLDKKTLKKIKNLNKGMSDSVLAPLSIRIRNYRKEETQKRTKKSSNNPGLNHLFDTISILVKDFLSNVTPITSPLATTELDNSYSSDYIDTFKTRKVYASNQNLFIYFHVNHDENDVLQGWRSEVALTVDKTRKFRHFVQKYGTFSNFTRIIYKKVLNVKNSMNDSQLLGRTSCYSISLKRECPKIIEQNQIPFTKITIEDKANLNGKKELKETNDLLKSNIKKEHGDLKLQPQDSSLSKVVCLVATAEPLKTMPKTENLSSSDLLNMSENVNVKMNNALNKNCDLLVTDYCVKTSTGEIKLHVPGNRKCYNLRSSNNTKLNNNILQVKIVEDSNKLEPNSMSNLPNEVNTTKNRTLFKNNTISKNNSEISQSKQFTNLYDTKEFRGRESLKILSGNDLLISNEIADRKIYSIDESLPADSFVTSNEPLVQQKNKTNFKKATKYQNENDRKKSESSFTTGSEDVDTKITLRNSSNTLNKTNLNIVKGNSSRILDDQVQINTFNSKICQLGDLTIIAENKKEKTCDLNFPKFGDEITKINADDCKSGKSKKLDEEINEVTNFLNSKNVSKSTFNGIKLTDDKIGGCLDQSRSKKAIGESEERELINSKDNSGSKLEKMKEDCAYLNKVVDCEDLIEENDSKNNNSVQNTIVSKLDLIVREKRKRLLEPDLEKETEAKKNKYNNLIKEPMIKKCKVVIKPLKMTKILLEELQYYKEKIGESHKIASNLGDKLLAEQSLNEDINAPATKKIKLCVIPEKKHLIKAESTTKSQVLVKEAKSQNVNITESSITTHPAIAEKITTDFSKLTGNNKSNNDLKNVTKINKCVIAEASTSSGPVQVQSNVKIQISAPLLTKNDNKQPIKLDTLSKSKNPILVRSSTTDSKTILLKTVEQQNKIKLRDNKEISESKNGSELLKINEIKRATKEVTCSIDKLNDPKISKLTKNPDIPKPLINCKSDVPVKELVAPLCVKDSSEPMKKSFLENYTIPKKIDNKVATDKAKIPITIGSINSENKNDIENLSYHTNIPHALKKIELTSNKLVATNSKFTVPEPEKKSNCTSQIHSTSDQTHKVYENSEAGGNWGKPNEGYDFVSYDAAENADNFHEDWNKVRNVSNVCERYRAIRELWRNLAIPDPSRNLTFRHARGNPAPFRRHKVITNRRQRSLSCSSIYESMIENATLNAQTSFLELEQTHQQDMNKIAMYYRQLSQYHYPGMLMEDHDRNLQSLNLIFSEHKWTIQKNLENEIRHYQDYIQEIRTFHSFYQGLDENDNANKMTLTAEQVDMIDDAAKTYEAYNQIYRNNRR